MYGSQRLKRSLDDLTELSTKIRAEQKIPNFERSGHRFQFGLFKISLLLALILANAVVVKIFLSLIYTNFLNPYLYPLEKWFATYFELSTIMRNFIVLSQTCDWLLSKFVSKFYLGGLGSYGRTVSHIFLKVVLFLSFIGLHGLP